MRPVGDPVKETEGSCSSKESVDSEHQDIISQPTYFPVIPEKIKVGDTYILSVSRY